jgi:hypothetical protein
MITALRAALRAARRAALRAECRAVRRATVDRDPLTFRINDSWL